MMRRWLIVLLLGWCGNATSAWATNRFYPNLSVLSDDGMFRADAVSPENVGRENRSFAAHFVYTLTDVRSGRQLWRRQQREQDGSCTALYVDSDGWVAIIADGYEIVVINPQGQQTGRINLLADFFTEQERIRYVETTTAGPRWSGNALWYWMKERQRRLFVVRPWWGRRMVLDAERGTLFAQTATVTATCLACETEYVLQALRKGVASRTKWENEDRCCEDYCAALTAIYLAGVLRISEAIPLLKQVQRSPFRTERVVVPPSPVSGVVLREYDEFTVRQIAHLSLRRLGVTPDEVPCIAFTVAGKLREKRDLYIPPSLTAPRATRAALVHHGQTPEQVLALIGAPDFITDEADFAAQERVDLWYYEMDGPSPSTLLVRWRKSQVEEVERKSPPLWGGELWDRKFCY